MPPRHLPSRSRPSSSHHGATSQLTHQRKRKHHQHQRQQEKNDESDHESANDQQSVYDSNIVIEGDEVFFEVHKIIARRRLLRAPTKKKSQSKKSIGTIEQNEVEYKPEEYEYLIWWKGYPRNER